MSRATLVCVMGIDGSGKSTAVEAVVARMNEGGFDVGYVWNRWEPKLLNRLLRGHRERGARNGSAPGHADAYRSKNRLLSNPVMALAWLTVASMDYALTGVPRIRRASRTHSVVICDRYTPDFVVDQAMNLGGREDDIQRASRALFLRLFPKPRLYVLFDVDPSVALGRKDDGLDSESADHKARLYRSIARRVGATVVDANRERRLVENDLMGVVLQIVRGEKE